VAVLIVLVAITAVQVVLGELLPKTVALRYPEKLAMATLPPMRISQWVFRPLVAVFNGSAFKLMKLWNLQVDHSHAHVHSPEELAGLYRASAAGGLIDASERDMLAGILNVDDRLVREIMTPRPRLVTVPDTMSVADALARLAGGPHTRFPVTGADGDVVGLVHLRDLFVHAQLDPDHPVSDVTRPVVAVAEVVTVPHCGARARRGAALRARRQRVRRRRRTGHPRRRHRGDLRRGPRRVRPRGRTDHPRRRTSVGAR
jgi:putative hemolysin